MPQTNVLYISYDGMTDPLGQSQVIPYLEGLSKLGYTFTLISFEKAERFAKSQSEISARLQQSNIKWVSLSYTKKPPILSTVWDIWRMKEKAFELHRKENFKIVHCRSYISALVGMMMKKKYGTKFIFDMRGFYADERVDGGLWPLTNPVYRKVYQFFKKKEKEFLNEADYIISLTQKAKGIIHQWKDISNQPVPIQVIPCCADLELFSTKNIDVTLLEGLKKQFKLTGNEFVLSYLGSIGTWYMLDEMLDFFKYVLQVRPDAKFLFITNEQASNIIEKANARKISEEALIITPAPHKQVPTYLALSNCGIFFVKPVFSKSASSPTKQAEIMGMGIPHICNAGVGDVDAIVDERTGEVVQSFNLAEYERVSKRILSALYNAIYIRQKAKEVYSLDEGIEKYAAVYAALGNQY